MLVLLRLFGKRTAAQLNSFDLVVLLLLSSVVQNAIIGPDNSLAGGLIGAAALVAVNDGVVCVFRRSERLDRAIEGTETRLVVDGAFIAGELRRRGIRRSDLEVALRRQGAEHVRQVRAAELYPSGRHRPRPRPRGARRVVRRCRAARAQADELVAAVASGPR